MSANVRWLSESATDQEMRELGYSDELKEAAIESAEGGAGLPKPYFALCDGRGGTPHVRLLGNGNESFAKCSFAGCLGGGKPSNAIALCGESVEWDKRVLTPNSELYWPTCVLCKRVYLSGKGTYIPEGPHPLESLSSVGEMTFLRRPLRFLNEHPDNRYEIGVTDVDRSFVEKFIWREWARACPLKAVLTFCLGSLDPHDYFDGGYESENGADEVDNHIMLRLWGRGYIRPDEFLKVGILEDCYHFGITPSGRRALRVLEYMHKQPYGTYSGFLYAINIPEPLKSLGFLAHLEVPKRV